MYLQRYHKTMKEGFIKYKLKAFTLAEVLITLAIIGIVATITIPALMNNIQDAQLKTAWKKQYSVFSQATQSIINDNGGSGFKNIAGLYSHHTIRDFYLDKLKYIKKCDDNDAYGNCWTPVDGTGYGATKFLSGTKVHTNNVPMGTGDAGAILVDGAFVLFAYQDNNCNSGNSPASYEGITNACGWITIDVNGAKGPNIFGRDIYSVWLLDNKISPIGTQDFSNTCTTSGNGLGCAALYLIN